MICRHCKHMLRPDDRGLPKVTRTCRYCGVKWLISYRHLPTGGGYINYKIHPDYRTDRDRDLLYKEGPWKIYYYRKAHGIMLKPPEVVLYWHSTRVYTDNLNYFPNASQTSRVSEMYRFWKNMMRP